MKPIIFPFNILANPWNAIGELLKAIPICFFLGKLFGVKKPPSPYQQALQSMKAKRTADQWAYDDWIERNPWYNDWRNYASDAARTFGDYGDRFAQAQTIEDMYQRDVDSLFEQNVRPLLGSGIGSYESDQQGLFGDRARAATAGARAFGESNQKIFSDGLAQMAKKFGTEQGGFGSGFASAFGEAAQQGAQSAADMFASAQQGIAADKTDTYDKVFSAQSKAPSKIDEFRKNAFDSLVRPTEASLAGWDSITSRERQNAPQMA